LEQLSAFQSIILNLLLRANQTVAVMMGGHSEVGMITLALTKVGLAIPALTATVSCVSVARDKVAKPVVVKEEVLSATKAELDAVHQQLKTKSPRHSPAPVSQNFETFLTEMETIAALEQSASTVFTSTTAASTTATSAGTAHTNTTHTTTSGLTIAESDNLLQKSGKHVAQGVSALVHGAGATLSQAATAVNTVVDTVAKGVEKGVNAVIIRPVQGVVHGIESALDAVHKELKEEDDVGVLEATAEIAKRVQRHGFRLCNPRWLDLTIGTVLGCALYIEPMPKSVTLELEETETPNDLAEAIWHLFTRAINILEKGEELFEENAVSLNSVNLRAAGLGLGIPVLTFGITLDRK
jgi:hypothetical protein